VHLYDLITSWSSSLSTLRLPISGVSGKRVSPETECVVADVGGLDFVRLTRPPDLGAH
jgi:hypothetical protein